MNRCNRIMKKQEGKIYRTPENPTLVCMRWVFFFNGKKIRRQACCEICYFHAQLHVKIIGLMRQIMRATPNMNMHIPNLFVFSIERLQVDDNKQSLPVHCFSTSSLLYALTVLHPNIVSKIRVYFCPGVEKLDDMTVTIQSLIN